MSLVVSSHKVMEFAPFLCAQEFLDNLGTGKGTMLISLFH